MYFTLSESLMLSVSVPKYKQTKVSSVQHLDVSLMKGHINKIVGTANSTLGFLRKNLKTFPCQLNENFDFSWLDHA